VYQLLGFGNHTDTTAGTTVLADSTGSANSSEEPKSAPPQIITAHGVLMAALFAIFFPLGAIILRASRSPNAAWIHGAWQLVSYVGALAGFGLGAWIATYERKVSQSV
jgi:hypothetical protein